MAACPKCGASNSLEQQASAGNSVCVKCGYVAQENSIVSEITFAEGSGGGSSMIGQFVRANATHASIGAGFGTAMGGRSSQEIRISRARQTLIQMASKLVVPRSFVDQAHRLFVMACERRFVQGRRTEHVLAACLYMICRREKTPHMLIDFSDAQRVNVFVLGKTFTKFAQILHMSLPNVDPSLYLHRFASKLEYGSTDTTLRVAATALRIVSHMEADFLSCGRRPAGVCGAALVIASPIHGFRRTPKEVARVVCCGPGTIVARLRELARTSLRDLTVSDFNAGIDGSGNGLMGERTLPPSFARTMQSVKAHQMPFETVGSGGIARALATYMQRTGVTQAPDTLTLVDDADEHGQVKSRLETLEEAKARWEAEHPQDGFVEVSLGVGTNAGAKFMARVDNKEIMKEAMKKKNKHGEEEEEEEEITDSKHSLVPQSSRSLANHILLDPVPDTNVPVVRGEVTILHLTDDEGEYEYEYDSSDEAIVDAPRKKMEDEEEVKEEKDEIKKEAIEGEDEIKKEAIEEEEDEVKKEVMEEEEVKEEKEPVNKVREKARARALKKRADYLASQLPPPKRTPSAVIGDDVDTLTSENSGRKVRRVRVEDPSVWYSSEEAKRRVECWDAMHKEFMKRRAEKRASAPSRNRKNSSRPTYTGSNLRGPQVEKRTTKIDYNALKALLQDKVPGSSAAFPKADRFQPTASQGSGGASFGLSPISSPPTSARHGDLVPPMSGAGVLRLPSRSPATTITPSATPAATVTPADSSMADMRRSMFGGRTTHNY